MRRHIGLQQRRIELRGRLRQTSMATGESQKVCTNAPPLQNMVAVERSWMSCGSRNHSRPSSDMATPRVVGTKSGRPSSAPARLNPLAPWDGGHGPGGAVVLAQQQARHDARDHDRPAPLLAMPGVPEAPSGSRHRPRQCRRRMWRSWSQAEGDELRAAPADARARLRAGRAIPARWRRFRGYGLWEAPLGNECGTAQRRAVATPVPHHATRRAR